MNYSRNDLMRIGNNVASVWGAYCTGFIRDGETETITFQCSEFGEQFTTELKFAELPEYDY